MIDKQIKSKILNFYEKKQDKMLVSMIIEKVNKFETGNHLIYTTFLNMYEKEIAISVLNKLNISYYIYSPLEDTSKFIIFFFPEYMEVVLKSAFFRLRRLTGGSRYAKYFLKYIYIR